MGHKNSRNRKAINRSIIVSLAMSHLINDSEDVNDKNIKNLKDVMRNNFTHVDGRKIQGFAKIRNG